nr:MAG TPA: hypothetical protein [Caudoviricetes sp.]
MIPLVSLCVPSHSPLTWAFSLSSFVKLFTSVTVLYSCW